MTINKLFYLTTKLLTSYALSFAVVFGLASGFTSTTLAAKKPTTLVKEVVVVGFAPPAYRGIHTVEILSNGNVQYTDNKGVKSIRLKLSKEAMAKLNQYISEFSEGEVYGEDGPKCMDAPTEKTIVMKDGKEIVTKTIEGCNTKAMSTAWAINPIMEAASTLAKGLK